MAVGTEREPRKKIWVHLRSGAVIKFRARTFDAKTEGGKISSYSWDGTPARSLWFWRRRPIFIDPSEIIAVEVRGG